MAHCCTNLADIAPPLPNSQTRSYVFLWPPVQTESKWSPRYVGPCEIKKIILPAVMKLNLPPALQCSTAFHLSLLKPVSTSALRNSLNLLRSQCFQILGCFMNIKAADKNTPFNRGWIISCYILEKLSYYIFEREWKGHKDFLHLNKIIWILLKQLIIWIAEFWLLKRSTARPVSLLPRFWASLGGRW